eukprot:m.146659 g.146659  ORF g.146659 m.146659 type:complete len:156 (-) comp14154_c1_seq1:1357-1824(-)
MPTLWENGWSLGGIGLGLAAGVTIGWSAARWATAAPESTAHSTRIPRGAPEAGEPPLSAKIRRQIGQPVPQCSHTGGTTGSLGAERPLLTTPAAVSVNAGGNANVAAPSEEDPLIKEQLSRNEYVKTGHQPAVALPCSASHPRVVCASIATRHSH